MNDQYEHDENEEYHFDDNESLEFEEEPSEGEDFSFDEDEKEPSPRQAGKEKKTSLSSMSGKDKIVKILMGLGIVVVIYVGLRFMGVFSSGAPTASSNVNKPVVAKEEPPVNTQTQEVALPAQTAAPSSLTVQGLNPDDTSSVNAPASDAALKQIADLQAQQKNLVDALNALNQQNQQASDRMQNIERNIGSMENQVMQLNNALQTVITAVKRPPMLQRPMATTQVSDNTGYSATVTSPMPAKAAMTSSRISYYVQAIIPGRAWLRDSENRMMTVSKGDMIPGLGAVTAIDPLQGTVSISNGAVIEYGIPEE